MLPLQLMDFNGDRLTDIVLVARNGIYAWAQARPARPVPAQLCHHAAYG